MQKNDAPFKASHHADKSEGSETIKQMNSLSASKKLLCLLHH